MPGLELYQKIENEDDEDKYDGKIKP